MGRPRTARRNLATVLRDNGCELSGREDQHRYERLLQLVGIQHNRTNAARSQSNGIIESRNCALFGENFCEHRFRLCANGAMTPLTRLAIVGGGGFYRCILVNGGATGVVRIRYLRSVG